MHLQVLDMVNKLSLELSQLERSSCTWHGINSAWNSVKQVYLRALGTVNEFGFETADCRKSWTLIVSAEELHFHPFA